MGLEVGAPPESPGTGHAGAEAHTSKLAGTDTGTGIRYADTLFPKKHQYGDTDTRFLIKIKT
jgi:hypothetical protein